MFALRCDHLPLQQRGCGRQFRKPSGIEPIGPISPWPRRGSWLCRARPTCAAGNDARRGDGERPLGQRRWHELAAAPLLQLPRSGRRTQKHVAIGQPVGSCELAVPPRSGPPSALPPTRPATDRPHASPFHSGNLTPPAVSLFHPNDLRMTSRRPDVPPRGRSRADRPMVGRHPRDRVRPKRRSARGAVRPTGDRGACAWRP